MKMRLCWIACVVAGAMFAPLASGAMYKWVDEKGVTHYGDRVPPQYANPNNAQIGRTGVTTKSERSPGAEAKAPAAERNEAEAKRELEQRRQDNALLATYANEKEIDQARERELKRVQEWLAANSAGLARSKAPEDRKKLDAVMDQGRRDTDAVNSKYDAQKARFLELKGGPSRGGNA